MATPPPKRKYKDPKTVKKDAYWEGVGGTPAALMGAAAGTAMKKLFGKQGRLTKKQFGKAKKKNGPR